MTADLDLERIAALLDASRALVEAEVRALGRDASWHHSEGEWCANEVVGHLIEAERRGFNGRIRHFLRAERPDTEAWDQDAVQAERRDCDKRGEDLAREFSELRRDSIVLVRSLKVPDLDRSGMHPKVGELRVRDLVHEWVHHDRNHTKQLLTIAQHRAYPHMGNAQGFVGE